LLQKRNLKPQENYQTGKPRPQKIANSYSNSLKKLCKMTVLSFLN